MTVLGKGGEKVAFHVVDGNNGKIETLSKLFDKGNSSFKCRGKTRTDGDGKVGEI